jgi:hypothetical protein
VDPVVILQGAGPLTPGGQQTLNLRVRNQGRRVEGYRLTVLGPLSPHATVTQPELSVYPGREESADVVVSLPEGATTPTGTLPVGVLVQSLVEAESSAVAEVDLSIGGVSGLTVRALQTMRKARWSARYPIEIVNRGNTPARICLVGHDPGGELLFDMGHDVLDIPPGGTHIAQVKVKARHPFLRGSPQMSQFEIASHALPFGTERPFPGAPARPGDEYYRQVHLQMQRLPVISKGLMLLLGLLLLGIAALVVWSLRGGPADEELGVLAPPAPTGVQLTEVQSDSVTVQWAPVAAAATYQVWEAGSDGTLLRNLTDAEPLDAQTTKFTVPELEPSTAVCYTVIALAPEEGGESAPPEPACATTLSPAALAPPTELAAGAPEGTEVTLTWVPPAEPPEITGFKVFVDGTEAGDLDEPGRTFDLGEPGTYQVYVVAVAGELTSDKSNEIEVIIPEEVPTGNGSPDSSGGGDGVGVPVPGSPGTGSGDGPGGQVEVVHTAVIGGIQPGGIGSTPAEQRRTEVQDQLDAASIPVEVEIGTSADVLALRSYDSTQPNPMQQGASVLYVEAASQAAAETLCEDIRAVGLSCTPLELTLAD